MANIDRANLFVNRLPDNQKSLTVNGDDDVSILLTQVFGPTGENLVGISDIEFDGEPALTVRVRCGDVDGNVHLSPFHGDRRKMTGLDIADGAICELLCPVSGFPLARHDASDDDPSTDYFSLYLTEKLSAGEVVLLSNKWGHYSSCIVDNFELISRWLVDDE